MQQTAQLTGLFAAHGIWCVSDGGPLIPMLGYELPDGSRQMTRFATDALEQGVQLGRQQLLENPHGATRATLICDGYVTLESGKTDALLIESRHYGSNSAFAMAVPYRSHDHPDGFAVYRPKFLSFEGPEPDFDALAQAFFEGVDQHEKGSEVWNKHLDQSM